MVPYLNFVSICNIFQEIQKPVRFSVTKWRQDAHAGMAYSYLPVGVNGTVYDDMAAAVDGRVHFAGEVCINYDR